ALGGKDGSVRLWDVTNKKPVADFPAHQDKIVDLLLSSDKKTLVTTDPKGTVKVWDLATLLPLKAGVQPKPTKDWQAHNESIAAFAISLDGKRFVTAGQDNVVNLWDTVSGEKLRTWDFHLPKITNQSFIRGLAFTPDGKQIATANANTTAYLL